MALYGAETWTLRAADQKYQDGTQFHPGYAWKRSSKNCMEIISVECTVENS
jgi:hypothetical protein